ncbi:MULTISPECIES: SDR family oxidoreductase [Rhodococcus]|uniref:SDR family oxidoreductase n=1 Tax=Rhodococcus oxybenzonivorans TaxID=1990687 RepID=A0AAE4UZD4_9NOCA|nr:MULTISPECIES: SDR family oxidoreductase [Rhodococcus]MDV7240539.1 SDR family oxidoreductase [Rhodococcus oxybenzonivorans]MDV7265766.1 SDR family oxidoreductase [Rhodococcus oxybenzonivorans]MDV7272812.1 SDR family oxidoreductase [Rhodococcus oxybenzonivorans]MDV7333449.1 SDR family oxidoreductase [Rhodococcus oxybenzonivorans]MDV7342616.1 SDR family oxidoreductase [Rhodococcus oxybenzonivorans]
MSNRLAGKTAIVTGAGSGIGQAITLRFAAEGATVLAADVNDGVEAVARESELILPFRCDVSDDSDVRRLESEAQARFGGLDILVNNAGIGGASNTPLHEYPIEVFDKVHSVNLRGAFLVLQAGLRLMLSSGGGSVVNTASTGGFRATPGSSGYIISKGGMVMMTRQAGYEYAAKGIRVNAIAPGTIRTPILDSAPDEVVASLEARSPEGRLGTATEVANLALFLASDEASHIIGQCYVIDGGRTAG